MGRARIEVSARLGRSGSTDAPAPRSSAGRVPLELAPSHTRLQSPPVRSQAAQRGGERRGGEHRVLTTRRATTARRPGAVRAGCGRGAAGGGAGAGQGGSQGEEEGWPKDDGNRALRGRAQPRATPPRLALLRVLQARSALSRVATYCRELHRPCWTLGSRPAAPCCGSVLASPSCLLLARPQLATASMRRHCKSVTVRYAVRH